MIIERGAVCRRHRAALLALVDRQERGPATSGALQHLATCRRCENELTRLALTIHALRRIGEVVAAESPSDATWPRLRASLERSRRRARTLAWQWRMNLGGLVAGTLIVGVLVGPLAVNVSLSSAGGREPTGYSASEAEWIASQEDARFIQAVRNARLQAIRREVPSSVPARRIEGDGIQPEGKEVNSLKPGGVVLGAN